MASRICRRAPTSLNSSPRRTMWPRRRIKAATTRRTATSPPAPGARRSFRWAAAQPMRAGTRGSTAWPRSATGYGTIRIETAGRMARAWDCPMSWFGCTTPFPMWWGSGRPPRLASIRSRIWFRVSISWASNDRRAIGSRRRMRAMTPGTAIRPRPPGSPRCSGWTAAKSIPRWMRVCIRWFRSATGCGSMPIGTAFKIPVKPMASRMCRSR